MHAFKGRTVDNVIAAIEANHPNLTTQKYTEKRYPRAHDASNDGTDVTAQPTMTQEFRRADTRVVDRVRSHPERTEDEPMTKIRIDSIANVSVNGMRAHLQGLLGCLRTRQPDIVALQKFRMSEADFMDLAAPKLTQIGSRAVVLGKTSPRDYGVAIVSRTELGEPGEIARGWRSSHVP